MLRLLAPPRTKILPYAGAGFDHTGFITIIAYPISTVPGYVPEFAQERIIAGMFIAFPYPGQQQAGRVLLAYYRKIWLDFRLSCGLFDHGNELFREVWHGNKCFERTRDTLGRVFSFLERFA